MHVQGWSPFISQWLPFIAFWALLLALLVLEAVAPIHRAPEERRGRLLTNFSLGGLNGAMFALLPLSSVLSAGWAQDRGWGLMNVVAVPGAAAFVATVLMRNLAAYGLHVLAHKLPLLWRMHRIHHADTAVDLSTGFRHHPLELIFVSACYAGLSVAFGWSVVALIAYEACAISVSLWSHANLRLPAAAERAVSAMFVTPLLHHVHHSSAQPQTDRNYGELLIVWDWMFGTLSRLDHREVSEIRMGLGPEADESAASLPRELVAPFIGRKRQLERRSPSPSG